MMEYEFLVVICYLFLWQHELKLFLTLNYNMSNMEVERALTTWKYVRLRGTHAYISQELYLLSHARYHNHSSMQTQTSSLCPAILGIVGPNRQTSFTGSNKFPHQGWRLTLIRFITTCTQPPPHRGRRLTLIPFITTYTQLYRYCLFWT